MGHTLNRLGTTSRIFILLILLMSIFFAVVHYFPLTKKTLTTTYSIKYYIYNPQKPVISEIDTSKMPPAIAVPMLMYHGVTAKKDEANTTIDTFINQMEMLKREGYETITVAEYDLFRQGKFTLPPKPIVITFDDGRKDSYYTTDDVLNKLGFKATIFVASGPNLDGNTFYLTWDDLKKMRDSGRWEIQAHGRRSHERIPISAHSLDPKGDGRYLTSKIYLAKEGRLETDEEFKRRVEADYLNNINDLKNNLGIVPHYFAIPLNDYGQQPVSNYVEAVPFNQELIRKYFRIAFVQSNSSEDVRSFHLPVYNFKYDNPYTTRRIEVKNMEATVLKDILTKEAPTSPSYTFAAQTFVANDFTNSVLGTAAIERGELSLKAPAPNQSGQVIFGEPYWHDYEVKTTVRRGVGDRSAAVLFYYKDFNNYMSCGITDSSYFIRSTVDGKTTDLKPAILSKTPVVGYAMYDIVTKNGVTTCSINGVPLFQDVNVPISSGAAGFRVWSSNVKGVGYLQSFVLSQL